MDQNIFTHMYKRHKKQSRLFQLRVCIVGFFIFFLSLSVYVQGAENDTGPAASQWYKELAAQGDIDAKYNLGMMNETGWSIPVDIKKAIRWYREAAKQGHSEAQVRLGMLYYLGIGVKQSKLKGESWIRKAAKQEHSFAQLLYKKLFEEGVPDALDQKIVLQKVRETYLHDEAKAKIKLNQLVGLAKQRSTFQEKEKEKTTIRERREARIVDGVKIGTANVVDKSGVSEVRSQDKEVKPDRIESVVPDFIGKKSLEENRTLARGNIATIRLQAKKGLASAQYNLGRMYELGVKVPTSKEKALALYKKAAAQGYADAQYRLALSMLYGKSTERNERTGRKWLSSAAGNGHQIAQNLLASLTSQEGGADSNRSLAVNWYLERAIAGNAESAKNLGKIFEHGWGVIPDMGEAVKWYEHARMYGAKDVDDLLQDSKARLAKIKETTGETRGVTENFRPPDWIAYLAAVVLAVGIVFWPMIKRKRGMSIKTVSKVEK